MDLNEIIYLATQQHQQNKLDEALNLYQEALKIEPQNPQILFLSGSLCFQLRHYLKALDFLKQAENLGLNIPELFSHLGLTFFALNQKKEAIHYFQVAINLTPENLKIKLYMAQSLIDLGLYAEALDLYQNILLQNPNESIALNGQGLCLAKQMKYADAIKSFQRAREANSSSCEIQNNLATIYCQTGDLKTGYHLFGQVTDRNYLPFWSNWLFYLNHNPSVSLNEVNEQVKQFGAFIESKINKKYTFSLPKKNNNKVKLGYLSADFRRHSVAYFLLPIFRNHNRDKFEIIVYSNGTITDEVTQEFKKCTDKWNDISQLSDQSAADLIFNDNVDVLIDLSVHTEGGRLAVVAMKPAPVTVNYLGYPASSGLLNCDYRFTDIRADPLNTEQYYSEQLVRFEKFFLCFDSPVKKIIPKQSPYKKNGYITYGSFNDISKLTPEIIAMWSTILNNQSNSRLIIKNKCLSDQTIKEKLLVEFHKNGVSHESLQIHSWIVDSGDHLSLYDEIDIALDTYPYNGTTTTCEALCKGVPVITLCGKTHASRVGYSLLDGLGLSQLVAFSDKEYVSKAVELAAQKQTLSSLHESLSNVIANSELTNATHFTQIYENQISGLVTS